MSLNITPRVMRSIITDAIPTRPRKDTVYYVGGIPFVGGVSSSGLTYVPNTPGALEDALDAAYISETPVVLRLLDNVTYTAIRNPICNVYTTSVIGYNTKLNASNVQIGWTFDYNSPTSTGSGVRQSKVRIYEGLEIFGVGKYPPSNLISAVGLWVNSTGAAVNAPRPSFRNFFIHDFETGYGGRDQFYLGDSSGLVIYNCRYGIWQQAGVDSGEMCVDFAGSIDLCDCMLRVDDPSAEWLFLGKSFDYSRQMLVVTNRARVTFMASHPENRGKQLGTDIGNYVVNGSGADIRAPFQGIPTLTDGVKFVFIPIANNTSSTTITNSNWGTVSIKKRVAGVVTALTGGEFVNGTPAELTYSVADTALIWDGVRNFGNIPCASNTGGTANAITIDNIVTLDCFIDVNGDGSLITFPEGTHDVNGSGGAGAYDWYRYVKVRHAGSTVIFKSVYGTNFKNKTNLFWDGPGQVICGFVFRQGSDPSVPSRLNHESRTNLICDMDFTGSLGKQQQWWIQTINSGPGGSPANTDISPTNRYTAIRPVDSVPIGSLSIASATAGNVTMAGNITGEVLTVSSVSAGLPARDMVLSGTGITANTRIIGPIQANSDGTGTWLVNTIHTNVTVAAITGTIALALKITKSIASAGPAGRFRISLPVKILPVGRVSANLLCMVPSSGGMSGGNFTVTAQFCRLSDQLDSNGLPQVIETFSQIGFQSINTTTVTKNVWTEITLNAWGAQAHPPAGATHYLISCNSDAPTTAGDIFLARNLANAWGW